MAADVGADFEPENIVISRITYSKILGVLELEHPTTIRVALWPGDCMAIRI